MIVCKLFDISIRLFISHIMIIYQRITLEVILSYLDLSSIVEFYDCSQFSRKVCANGLPPSSITYRFVGGVISLLLDWITLGNFSGC